MSYSASAALARKMAKQMSPIYGVMYISSAGRTEMKVMDTPERVPSSAARGVIVLMITPLCDRNLHCLQDCG